MRNRLKKLLKQLDFDYGEECVACSEDGYKCAPDFAEFFADRLLANGIIVLPCPIGTKIYHIALEIPDGEPSCSECPNNYSSFGDFICDEDYLGWPSFEDWLNDPTWVCPRYKPVILERPFTLSFWADHEKWFNKSWFLTKEEAEAARAERSER